MDLQDKLDKSTKRFYRIRNLTEQICSLFSESENNLQIGYDVSPNKWQLGHTSWFFEKFIIKSKTKKFYNQDYFFLFNSYYNSQGKYIDKSIRYTIDKPSLNEVLEYRNYINREIEKIIGKGLEKDTYFLIELGLQHEQQHQELILSDTKYSLFHSNNLEAKLNKRGPSPAKGKYNFYSMDEGLFEIGVDIPGLRLWVEFEYGEPIVTEISQKFDRQMIESLAVESGFKASDFFFDGKNYFTVAIFVKQ